MKGDEIVRACDRHNNETVTLEKNVTESKHERKWMVEFLSKSACRGIKIARVNSNRITKLSIFINFLCAVPLHDVIKRTRFLMRLPVIFPPWRKPQSEAEARIIGVRSFAKQHILPDRILHCL